jgi:DNA-binding response OmpR family regulator
MAEPLPAVTGRPFAPTDPRFILLLADADEPHAYETASRLGEHHVDTFVCADGAEALLRAGTLRPEAILLAAEIPVVDAVTLVRVLRRQYSTPVIVGTDRSHPKQTADALAAGATAHVERPYQIDDVLPLLYQSRPFLAATPDWQQVRCGNILLDPVAHQVQINGHPAHLPPREFVLLHLLMTHAGRLVTHEEIRKRAWGPGFRDGSNTVVVHIRRLRARLGDDPRHPQILQTVRGLGYRLVPQ